MVEPPRRPALARGRRRDRGLALVASRACRGLCCRPPAVAAGGLALALLAGGAGRRAAAAAAWGDLSAIVGRGIDGLPGARMPYRGAGPRRARRDPARRHGARRCSAALLAFWPRRRRAPASRPPRLIVLVTLYASPPCR